MTYGRRRRRRPGPPDPNDEERPARELREGAVTRMAVQKRDAERVSVFIDDRFAFGASAEVVLRAGLHKGQRLTVAEQEALIAEDAYFRAKATALNYLAHQPRTTEEVRRRLRKADYPAEVVEQAVERVAALGYLDDAGYARAYVRSRFNARGYGPQRIRADLAKRGLRGPLVEDALAALAEAEDLDAAAREHAAKRWRRLARETDLQKRRRKTIDFLVRRGYDYGTAREALDAAEQDEPHEEAD